MNPLIGPKMDYLGPRFPDMSAVYDKNLLQLARKSALVNGIPLRKGVYVGLTNVNLPDCMQKTSIEEVVEAADSAGALLSDLWEKIITELPGEYFFYNELLDKIGIDIDFTIYRQKPGRQANTVRIFIYQP